MKRHLCVFCGAHVGVENQFASAAKELGAGLAKMGWGLVYGGGRVGLMGLAADAALHAGGDVIGVIPQSMVIRELAHEGLSELIVTDGMHERKAIMASKAHAFLALPGGFGTLDELCEIITWAQLGHHSKRIYLINVGGYYDKFIEFIDHAVQSGFVSPQHQLILNVFGSVSEFLDSRALQDGA